ncbi:MAG: protein translocase subunit SecD, partial [Acidobacteriota bacterium]
DGSGPFRGLTREQTLGALGGQLPPAVEILPVLRKNEQTGERETVEWMAVERTSVATGTDLQDARPSSGQWGDIVVSFSLKATAVDRFARFTRENINRLMPVVLDEKIFTAPVIRSEIPGQGQIEGTFTREEADDLALALRSGALPARVHTIEERTVGPSLGRDSILSGVRAIAIGFVFVLAFMIIYYRLSGINAIVALVMNLVIVAAAMATLPDATLTLPGIAGFILTVGMAVDANVLIFERIREEIRAGKTIRGALDGGFSKALSAIIDANITTLIAAIFLFNYGTGPVRGFAVTLSIGILASMFTAIFVSRVLFDLALGDRAAENLSI